MRNIDSKQFAIETVDLFFRNYVRAKKELANYIDEYGLFIDDIEVVQNESEVMRMQAECVNMKNYLAMLEKNVVISASSLAEMLSVDDNWETIKTS